MCVQADTSRYDTTSSILDHPLEVGGTGEPSTKKARTENGDNANTISAKVNDGRYATLDELRQDIARACAALIAPIKSKERSKNGAPLARPPLEDVKALQRITAFEHVAYDILKREQQLTRAAHSSVHTGADGVVKEESSSNGIKKEPGATPAPTFARDAKTVLTLYGNAPTPRQLFSSLQQAPSAEIKGDVPIEELGLPTMITATKVLPLQQDDSLKKRNGTFGDVFAPPPSVPQLHPPKTSKHSLNRSGSISFVAGTVPQKTSSRKAGFPSQSLTVGEWLSYGGVDTAKYPSSSAAKRKQRDRALSSNEATRPTAEELSKDPAAEEEALFRAAYSSFAPTRDDSKAIVPVDIKKMMWWQRVGEKRYQEHFVLDPALEEPREPSIDTASDNVIEMDGEDEAELFRKAMEGYDETIPSIDHLMAVTKREHDDPEQLLRDVSELLETLASHQRIRHSILSASTQSRTPASPSPLLGALVGTPDTPSAEETDTYKTLRAQLAEMIERLPPYAVAKLDGEQLEELKVSKKIIMEGKEYRGTMEEDQLSRLSRSNAMAAAAGLARPASAASGFQASSQYGRTPSVSQAVPRPAHASSYYGSNRTPAPAFNRSTSGSQNYGNYGTPTATATASRPSYGQMSAFNQANRAGQTPAYGQANSQQFYNRPAYGQQYGASSTPSAQPQARPGFSAPQSAYGNRMQNSAAFSQNGANGSPYTRPASTGPVQGGGVPQQNGQYQPGSGRATPNNFPQTPGAPSAVGPSGFHTSMTSEQQQLMMERQRAQLAMQPQGRMAAPGQDAAAHVQRASSGTPQPPAQGGERRGGGTPMVA